MHPGQPVLPATISHRLARIGVNTVTGRASALLQLAGELPPTVVADLLGLRPKTAIAWGQLAGRPWAAYPGLRDQRPLTRSQGCQGGAPAGGAARIAPIGAIRR